MENHPSKDSTKSPSSSPQHPPPPPPPPPPSYNDANTNTLDLSLTIQNTNTNSGGGGGVSEGQEGKIMKTALQVLAELASNESPNDGGGDGDRGGMSQSGGGGASLALAVGGGSMVVVQEGVGGDQGRAGKKRKSSDVKDPPSGKPACPLCHKEFLSWKGAFGHMRKHPERDYRGFHKPPSFSSPSSLPGANQGDGEGKSTGEDRLASSPPTGGALFDLNQPIMDGAGSSNAVERNEAIDEEKKLGFDLNELPSDEDDNEEN